MTTLLRALLVVVLVALLALLVITFVGLVLADLPGAVQIDQPFIYPQADRLLLATDQGPYVTRGPALAGCYILSPAQTGEPYGQAAWVWPVCGKGG